MNARMYQLAPVVTPAQQKYIDGLKGQAKVVYDALDTLVESPALGVDIDKVAAPKLVTRQDTLRVTLYYVIIFKGKGIVRAFEQVPATPEPATEDVAAGGPLDHAGE